MARIPDDELERLLQLSAAPHGLEVSLPGGLLPWGPPGPVGRARGKARAGRPGPENVLDGSMRLLRSGKTLT